MTRRRTSMQRGRASPAQRNSHRLHIDVVATTPRLARLIRAAARHALRAEGVRDGRLGILTADATEMRRFHRRWLGIGNVTDVLTFDLSDRPNETAVDAQIVVCIDAARARARASGASWQQELLLYVVHGCLHLRGYDDRRAADARVMHRREDVIMTELGYGPAYSLHSEGMRATNPASAGRAQSRRKQANHRVRRTVRRRR